MRILLRDIGKRFGRRGRFVLQGIEMDIGRRDFVAVLGESGCGKSTLLKMIAGLVPPTTGEILLEGPNRPTERVHGPAPSRSMLFQQPSLLPWLTVRENIAFGCRLRGELEDLAYRTDQFIEMMGLYGHGDKYPSELSVGQAQRVCLARALIGHPEVLLLDEPFSALDTLTRTRLQEEFINIWQSEGFTAVFVTHDIEEAILLGRRVVLLGGYPTRVEEVFDIDLPYPRRITDERFFLVKNRIIERFREVVVPPDRRDYLSGASCPLPGRFLAASAADEEGGQ